MKKYILVAAFLLIQRITFSQTPADKWYFGVYAGMDFSSGSPIAISNGAINTNEGCSSMADSTGNLLFYTDGISVWNKNHQVMPNGTGLMGGSSSTQAALIVPQPVSSTLYYIFTTDETGGPNGCRYSIVDITLQGGFGDVTSKNVLVLNNVTEKLSAIQQYSGIDYRVAIHEWGSQAFYVYSLTAAGLQMTPIISNTGMVHSTSQIQNTYGQMKFSPCGDRLALAAGYLDTVEIFDFDDVTGIVSNPITLPMTAHVYGLEFSQNGRYLYVSTYDVSGTLLQFDLISGNAATILSTKTVLSLTPDTYALQLAPDRKIYVCKSFNSTLGVINDPSIGGTGCNYVDNGFDLDPNFTGIISALGLPAFVQSFFRDELGCTATGIEELMAAGNNTLYPNPSADGFAIKFSNQNIPSEIIISDEGGRIIQQAKLTTPIFSFGELFAPGIYFVTIKNNSYVEVLMAVKTGK